MIGQLLASAGNDGIVKIWDVFRAKACVMTLQGHEGGFFKNLFSYFQ
jgi:hypothetical protein